MKEQEKYEIIKKLVETSGNKDNAALKLSVSRRQINRMMKGYKEQGKAFFVHGNRGRKPATALSEDIRKRIVSLYQELYFDANFTHFTQLLAEREGILVSTTTIQSILEEHYILSPMVTKAKQKRISAHLKAVQKTASHKEAVEIQKNLVAVEDAHTRKPRKAFFGEQEQMDWSVCLRPYNQDCQSSYDWQALQRSTQLTNFFAPISPNITLSLLFPFMVSNLSLKSNPIRKK